MFAKTEDIVLITMILKYVVNKLWVRISPNKHEKLLRQELQDILTAMEKLKKTES